MIKPGFKSLPIKLKLMLIIMTTSLVVLLIASASFILHERVRMKGDIIRDLTLMASLIADRSTAALVFHDDKVATETLLALRINHSIVAASIYDENGKIFAQYNSKEERTFTFPEQVSKLKSGFKNDYLTILEPIVMDKSRIGTVYIRASLREYYHIWQNILLTSALTLVLAIFIAFILATWLQRYISHPIEHLKKTAQHISLNRDYSIRATLESRDELGELVAAFNIMIETIQMQNGELIRANEDLEYSDQRLREANEKLEHRVDIRTQELRTSNQKLTELADELTNARDEAESASQAKSQFLASMSHEIRTPINAIMGMQYLLQKTEMNLMQQNYITKSQSAARSLLNIINDILDFSKIEAGKLDIEKIPFETENLLEDLNNIVGFKAQEKGLDFHIKRDPEIPFILVGDELRLGQILKNLGNNAVKFTQDGEINVTISCLKLDSDTVSLKFCIDDSGIGMTPEQQTKLFKDFSQVDTSLSRRYEGSGLGLVISKKLVEMMNGKIWLEYSKPGIGSTFCFTVAVGVANNQTKTSLKLDYETHKLLSNKSLLIVDDNDLARTILCRTAESLGLKSVTAASGGEAEKALEKNTFDIVLMDYKMPKMNGIEAASKILKNDKIQPKPKIVIVTAYSKEDIMSQVVAAQLNGLLLKPVSPSTMLDTFVRLLGNIQTATSKNNAKNISLDPIRGARVLLVEDNDINREFAKEMLISEQILVDEAVDGFDAIEKIKEQKYELILMDIQMPKLDGIEATKQIRAQSGRFGSKYYQKIPIIALSANALKNDIDRSLASGLNAYVTKPIDPNELYTVMLKHIDHNAIECRSVGPTNKNHHEQIIYEKGEKDESIKSSYDFSLLHGINLESVLNRLNNNETIFIKLLKKFYDNNHDGLISINQHMEEGDFREAEKICHIIKGIAGNLGIDHLFKKLNHIDDYLKKSNKTDQALMQSASEEFDAVMQGIESFLSTNTVTENNRKYEENDYLQAIDALQDMMYKLDSDFSTCAQIFLKFKKEYSKMVSHTKLMTLENGIKYMDKSVIEKILPELIETISLETIE
jgi:signal transduction histidine kinase/DNA-binding response OmpR family regulator